MAATTEYMRSTLPHEISTMLAIPLSVEEWSPNTSMWRVVSFAHPHESVVELSLREKWWVN
jgi:hypothetical protein